MEEVELLSFKPAKASEFKLYIWAILCVISVAAIPIAVILLLVAWARIASTKYRLTNQRLFVKSGIISRQEEEIELYRVQDVKLSQKISQRLFGIGDIVVVSTDKTTPILKIKGVRDPEKIKETLRTAYREARQQEGVRKAECIS